jgi:methylated-DNA-[protein]-cysteine S-methyltransferase
VVHQYRSPVATSTHTIVKSLLGDLTIVARGDAVIGLYFPNHWYRPGPAEFGSLSNTGFDAVRRQVGEYLAGERREFDVELVTSGTEFQEHVWALIRAIPYGETATYGDLARELADGSTPQEVGAAVGRNPISLVVPCHRVVGAAGKLTGYAGGLHRKQFLLDLEAETADRPWRLF